jgi:hypothetical protein
MRALVENAGSAKNCRLLWRQTIGCITAIQTVSNDAVTAL